MFKDHGCNVYPAADIKKHVSVPVATLAVSTIRPRWKEIIASGKADIVYMARALLVDPFLPRKVVENRENEIVKCLRCFTCMAERTATSTRRCTVNPLIGREIEGSEVYPAPVKKKVLVAGGGPGGLYAAYTATRRGHQVILCEKEDKQQILVPGTSVICALGQRSRSTLADSLRDSAPFVRVIGDAHRVSTITNAVYEGYHAALDI